MNTLLLIFLVSLATPQFLFAKEAPLAKEKQNIQTAVFAGGCFWCMQPPFDALKSRGIIYTSVGYSGGQTVNPTYEQTSAGGTGHREVIQVTYDATKIIFKDLLPIFWKNIDPYDSKGQFCDKGEQYTSAVFYANDNEKRDIEDSIKKLGKMGLKTDKKIVTLVLPLKTFYKGEEYHQAYYEKNPVRYKYYRYSCGRDARLKEVWETSSN